MSPQIGLNHGQVHSCNMLTTSERTKGSGFTPASQSFTFPKSEYLPALIWVNLPAFVFKKKSPIISIRHFSVFYFASFRKLVGLLSRSFFTILNL